VPGVGLVIVGIRLPCFRLAAALRRVPDPDAAAILLERFGRRRVLEVTARAETAGVMAGMAVREAVRLAPGAIVALDDPVRAAVAWRRVLDVLRALPGTVGDGGPGLAFLTVGRGQLPERWFTRVRDRLASTGLAVRCGAGPNRFVAFVATHRAGDAVCPPGCEAAFVADAPLALLPLDDAVALRFRLLGVCTLGRLAALPPAQLERFGPDAVRWRALANGYEEPETVAGVW
jgi:impB/mucB/samB family